MVTVSRHFVPLLAGLTLVTAVAIVASPGAAQGYRLVNIGNTGGPAPGAISYYGFGSLDGPSVSANGDVSFFATVVRPAEIGANAIFLGHADRTPTRMIADQYTVSPSGFNFASFIQLYGPVVSPDGKHVTFSADAFIENGETVRGIYTQAASGGPYAVVARGGSPGPGGVVFTSPGYATGLCMNNAGSVVFESGTFSFGGVFVGGQGGSEIIAHEGEVGPGGDVFDRFLQDSSSINATGDVAFTAVAGPDNFTYDHFGLYLSLVNGVGGGRTLSLIGHHGDAAPGGGQFQYIVSPEIADDGSVTFVAPLISGGDGIYRYDAGDTSLLARSGQLAPDGTSFNWVGQPAVGQDGTWYAFDASYGGPTTPTEALFLGRSSGGAYQRVAGIGDALLGSTITRIGFNEYGMTTPKYLGFAYELADGREGIAIAVSTAPEPNPLALLALAAPLIAVIFVCCCFRLEGRVRPET